MTLRQIIRHFPKLRRLRTALPVLQKLPESPQVLQHPAVERRKGRAVLYARIPSPRRIPERQGGAHREIAEKRRKYAVKMQISEHPQQNQTDQHRDGDGRDGVGIENLQQLNVAGDHRNQLPLVPPGKLRRAQRPELRENPMPDHRKQLKRNIMVALLLPVMENAPQQRREPDQPEQTSQQRPRREKAEHRKGRKHDGAELSQRAQQNRQQHKGHQWPCQHDELSHDLNSRPAHPSSSPVVRNAPAGSAPRKALQTRPSPQAAPQSCRIPAARPASARRSAPSPGHWTGDA